MQAECKASDASTTINKNDESTHVTNQDGLVGCSASSRRC